MKFVVAITTDHDIVAGVALQDVVAGTTSNRVIAFPAKESVVSKTAVEYCADQLRQDVGARSALGDDPPR